MLENTYQPSEYDALWQRKVDATLQRFTHLNIPAAQIFASATSGFRMRAEFKIWHEHDSWNYVMFQPGSKHQHYVIEQFPIASQAIQTLMPLIRQQLLAVPALSHKLFQVEFLSTTQDEVLVTLIYHKKLDEQWLALATALAQQLNIKIIGRARKQKLLTHDDFVVEQLQLGQQQYYFQQVEASFTQPNAHINTAMLNWACQQLGQNDNDLLELYCGNGNFTLPLSKQFRRVLATEISKTSINSARYNCYLNHVDNIDFIRMSSEEFTQALTKQREFNRLADIALDSYDLSTVLVDPPRAGLDQGTLDLIRRFDRILYISCNPETLVDNLTQLDSDFRIESLAFFDQFPYTDHIESGVLLCKNTASAL